MNKIFLSFILLVSLQTGNLWGATITRYVNPGSAGGNGTTSALTGANAAYASLNAWEAAEQQDLDIGNNIALVNCAGTTADTTIVTITGWTTSSADYIDIVGDNTTGKWNTGAYRLSAGSGVLLNIQEENVRLTKIQLDQTSTSEFDNAMQISVTGTADIRISHTVIRGNASVANNVNGIYAAGTGASSNIYIWNTVVYNFNSAAGFNSLVRINDADWTANVYSCTLANSDYGLRQSGGTVNAKNSYAYGADYNDYQGTISLTTSASADATGSAGLQNIAYSTVNFTNVTAGSEDLHLVSGTGLIDTGTDTSGDAAPLNFTDDIDIIARTGTWDVGADEFVAAGGTFTPIISLY